MPQVIDQAKVPIIKLVHERGMVAADMSFGQPDGLKTGWLVREHIEAMPALRPLLLLLKYVTPNIVTLNTAMPALDSPRGRPQAPTGAHRRPRTARRRYMDNPLAHPH